MNVQVWCETDIGLRRERNEDSFLIDESLGLFMVADGMGGHRGGEVASALAVQTVRDVILRCHSDRRIAPPRVCLTNAYTEASQKIFDKSREEGGELQGMGTTLVTAYLRGETLYVANVGDSRAYLFSRPYLWQITEDHSLINEQMRAGLLGADELQNLTPKNIITRSVGFEREVACDIIERDLGPGEMVLICSDGLSGLVEDQEINRICLDYSPDDIVPKCIEMAKSNGGDDNITAMLIYAKPHQP